MVGPDRSHAVAVGRALRLAVCPVADRVGRVRRADDCEVLDAFDGSARSVGNHLHAAGAERLLERNSGRAQRLLLRRRERDVLVDCLKDVTPRPERFAIAVGVSVARCAAVSLIVIAYG